MQEATVSDDGDSEQLASGFSRVEDAMERTAATTVAGALMELLAAAPLEAEQAHIWGAGELSIILAYRRITRLRRAAVKTSLIELVWRCRFVQKCVLESDICRCRLEKLDILTF